jgi:hypothetical protein
MGSERFWMNRDRKILSSDQIDDSYLVSIARFLCTGGGYVDFVTDEVIDGVFAEIARRGLAVSAELRGCSASLAKVSLKDKRDGSILGEMEMTIDFDDLDDWGKTK